MADLKLPPGAKLVDEGPKLPPGAHAVSDAPLSLTPGTEGSEPVGRFVNSFVEGMNPVSGLRSVVGRAVEPADPNNPKSQPVGLMNSLGEHIIHPAAENLRKGGRAIAGTGEFTGSPISRRVVGAGYLAGGIPMLGPAATSAGEQIGEGDVAGGLGSATALATGIAAPELMRGAGRGLTRIAEPVAENAVGVRMADRKFGRNIGRAVLDETTGVRPGTVSESAGNQIHNLAGQRDQIIANSPVRVNLGPSRMAIQDAMTKGAAGNSDIEHLRPMLDQLTEPKPGFAGDVTNLHPIAQGTQGPVGRPVIADTQPGSAAVAMRQRLGQDFTKFDTARPVSNETRAVGNQAYRALTDQVHQAIPESAPLDQRISNLIPARDAMAARELEPGMGGSVLKRIAARTGGLAAGALAGEASGHPIIGTALGAVVPEMLANPTVQMTAARGLDFAGKALQHPAVRYPLSVPISVLPRIKPVTQRP